MKIALDELRVRIGTGVPNRTLPRWVTSSRRSSTRCCARSALPGMYAAWIAVVVAIDPLCRWYAAVKQRRGGWWLGDV